MHPTAAVGASREINHPLATTGIAQIWSEPQFVCEPAFIERIAGRTQTEPIVRTAANCASREDLARPSVDVDLTRPIPSQAGVRAVHEALPRRISAVNRQFWGRSQGPKSR